LYSDVPHNLLEHGRDLRVHALTAALPGVYNQSNFQVRRAGIMLCPAWTARRWKAADTKACRKIP